jgi:sortase A
VSQQPFESWTRTEAYEEKGMRYSESGAQRRWSRGALALLGVTLILLSAGLVFADVRSVGEAEIAAPKSERLTLTIPEIKRVRDIPVYDGGAGDERKLAAGTVHLQETGFPWESEANVYISGHRLGYPRTKSFLVFWNLDELRRGSKVVLEDARDRRYVYEVFEKRVVGPRHVSVKKPIEDKNIVTLQTCTLPDYKRRLIVRAELVS